MWRGNQHLDLADQLRTGSEGKDAEDVSPAGKTMTALPSLTTAMFRKQAIFTLFLSVGLF